VPDAKSRKLPKLWVRLPGALHRKLVRLASHNRRSLNSEIVYRLEHSVRKEGKP
jgi:predicted HicB family RNase H-like nuclease